MKSKLEEIKTKVNEAKRILMRLKAELEKKEFFSDSFALSKIISKLEAWQNRKY